MEKHFLTVTYDGKVFEYSKTQKEGFESHKNTSGVESFRKYYTGGITGELKWVEVVKNPHLHNREEVNIILEDNGTRYYVNFNVMGQNGSIDTMAESLIRFLPGLERGSVYKLFPWCIKKGDVINGEVAKRTISGVSFKQGETKLTPSLSLEKRYQDGTVVAGDVPALVYAVKMGKNKPTAASIEARDEFLYDTLVKESDRLKFPNGTTQEQPQPKEEQKSKPTTSDFTPAQDEEDNDDLPF